jgi:hypothetical protein
MVYIVSRQAIKLCLILGDNTFVTLSFRPRGDSCMVKVEHTVLCEITCWLNIADSARLITVGFRRLSKAFHTLLRISKKREASIPKKRRKRWRGEKLRPTSIRHQHGHATISSLFPRPHTHTQGAKMPARSFSFYQGIKTPVAAICKWSDPPALTTSSLTCCSSRCAPAYRGRPSAESFAASESTQPYPISPPAVIDLYLAWPPAASMQWHLLVRSDPV